MSDAHPTLQRDKFISSHVVGECEYDLWTLQGGGYLVYWEKERPAIDVEGRVICEVSTVLVPDRTGAAVFTLHQAAVDAYFGLIDAAKRMGLKEHSRQG